MRIQELFGGIRVECGRRGTWTNEIRGGEAAAQVHAFARQCGQVPEQRQGPPAWGAVEAYCCLTEHLPQTPRSGLVVPADRS